MHQLATRKILFGVEKCFGWSIILSCIIGVAATSGPIVLTAAGVFMEELHREFGWDRGQVALSVTLYTLVVATMTPFAGSLFDRVGVRRVVLPAIALSAFALSVTTWITTLWHFYAATVLFSLVGAITTSMPYVQVTSVWFDRRRGFVLGIVASGIGLGFAVVPLLMQALLEVVGWRGAYIGVALVLLLLIFPIQFLLLRDSPADFGLLPDNRARGPTADTVAPCEGMSLQEALRKPTFWLLLVITFVFAFVFNGMTVHLVPLLKDNGLTPSDAVFGAAIMGMALFGSRILIGVLLDVTFAPKLGIVTFALGSLGLGLLAFNLSGALNLVAAALIGLGIGAETDIVGYMTSRYFGLRAFGKIYGAIFAFFYLGTGLGPLALGIAYDYNKSYTETLLIYASACVAVTLTFVVFGPYKYQRSH
jgi:MFS family permease